MTRLSLVVASMLVFASGAGAQEGDGERLAYFRAVATYFAFSPTEIGILGDWNLPADEIPVVLYVASRAGVSPEALVALRTSGVTWSELTSQYQINASTLHVPLGGQAPAGQLASAYDSFRSTPVGDWAGIALSDRDIVALVNVRVLAEVVDMRPEDILLRADAVPTFVELYGRLIG